VRAQNLVPNGDFELYTLLPNNYGQTNRATGWNNVNGVYIGTPYASPDYFNTAGTVPTFFGQILPFSGIGQMGFATFVFYLIDFREYISTTLVSPLVVGTEYQVSFALTNGNNGDYTKSTNNIGIRFSTGSLFQAVDQPISENPQIEITSITYNYNFWQTYTYFYTPTSAYNTITIGNFRDDASTLISPTGSSGAYYFIDNIIVQTATPLPIELLSFTGESDINKNVLQWTTASEINNDYFTLEKSIDGKTFQPIAKIEGAGNSTTDLNYSVIDDYPINGTNYYKLKQTDFNGTTWYSKTISLNSNSKHEIDFLIYPNPATDYISISYPNSNAKDEIKIINKLGETVFKTNNKHEIDVSGLQNGIYFIQLTTDKNISTKKMVVQH